MKIEIKHKCSDFNSYRAARVKSMFNVESGCNWEHVADLPLDDFNWKIGLIVGPSGSGKTSIGKAMFDNPIHDLYKGWDKDKPVIDCISPEKQFDEITSSLASVGLGDVPTWLRPFHVLSNGEQFRAGLARLICEQPQRVVVDEFTSVIDRQIAKVGASAFSKAWRRTKGQIVLLSCHYDIVEWLQPDWIYDTREARFTRECLRQRPKIKLEIYKVSGKLWKYFEPHHYLRLPRPVAASYYIGVIDGEPVCHIAFSPFFQCKAYRAARLVVLPEWQGIGIGTAFLSEMCRLHLNGLGRCEKTYPTYFTTAHPQMSRSLRNRADWLQVKAELYAKNSQKCGKDKTGKPKGQFGAHFRATQGFKYIGL